MSEQMNDAAAPRFTVNGQTVSASARSIAELLAHLRIDPQTVVAEVNGRIVPVEEWDAPNLSGGDRVELVRFVGGG